MKDMKFFLAFLLTILFFSSVSPAVKANGPICAGDSAFVTAVPGLKLRLSPDMESEVITTLDYGQAVLVLQVLDDRPSRIGWADGHWSEVRYETVTGYLFDGFLSSLPVPSPRLNSHDMSLNGLLREYAFEHYLPVLHTDTVNYHSLPDRHFHIKYSHAMDEGVSFELHRFSDRLTATLSIYDIRIMDAYHLLRGLLIPYEEGEELLGDLLFKQNQKGEIYEISSGHLQRIQISSKDGLITINVRDFVHTGS